MYNAITGLFQCGRLEYCLQVYKAMANDGDGIYTQPDDEDVAHGCAVLLC